jgi:drug/metabolite transporter (DMT)-like permease
LHENSDLGEYHRMPSLPLTAARRSSLYGFVAIILWSTTIAFSRTLTEQLGTLTAAAFIYTLAGLFGLFYISLQQGGFPQFHRLPRLYLLGCGALFVIYIAALYLAVGTASSRLQVLAVGLINYLWPALSLVFSIPILHHHARPWLPVGILMALAGVWLATTGDISPQVLLRSGDSLLPYGLALIAAVSWGLYSNLSRRWGGENEGGAVPIFLLTSGLLLGMMRLFTPETSAWTTGAVLELAYMALLPGMIAYVLWDVAVRKGEIILVASLSYLTPLLSTIFSILVLKVQPGASLWEAAGLIIAGAWICRVSVLE